MKKMILLPGLLACCLGGAHAQTQTPEWQNPRIPAVNKEYPATEFIGYTNREDTEKDDYNASPYYKPLDGTWKFRPAASPREIISEFYDPSFDDSGWEVIEKPSESVSAGMYRTEFIMPFAWADKQVFLNAGAFPGGVYVYVNGERVGYSEDSRSPAVFDITGFVREGRNLLALETHHRTTGSLLDAQHVGPIGGIEGSIHIKAVPKVRVRDFEIRTGLTDNYRNGVLDFGVIVKSHLLNEKSTRVYFELFSPDGELLKTQYKDVTLKLRQEQPVHFDALVPDVRAWSAENPNLYTVMIRLQYEGRYVENIRRKVGFRSVETDGNRLLVNGKPAKIKGVYLPGYNASDEETLRKDLLRLKEHNVNAIRTGTPQPSRFYELCDEAGFYVAAEANIESGGEVSASGRIPDNNPEFVESHLDRVRNLYERTKNFTSVILFSPADRTGNGYNFYEAYLWFKSREKERPMAHRGAGLEWNTDIYFPVHTSLDDMKEWAENPDRPYLLYDSTDALGRGADPADAWNEVFNRYDHMQGGFWRIEGDHSAASNTLSGLKEVFRNVLIEAGDLTRGEIRIVNRHDFTNLDQLTVKYTIEENGKAVASGTVPCAAAPGETATVQVNTALKKPKSGAEYILKIEITTQRPSALLPTGYVVASEQFRLPLGR